MVTMHDIARLARVDQSSVSKILRGATNFKQETINKVRAACDELDYIPNAAARQLRNKRTNTIAINIPFSIKDIQTDPFIPEFLSGVSQQTSQAGYSILLSYDDSDTLPELVLGQRADGIILTTTKANDSRISELTAKKIPFVAGKAQNITSLNAACVDVDNFNSGLRAGEYLIKQGHRKIAALYHKDSYVGFDFADGVRAALSKHKIYPNNNYFVGIDISAATAMSVAENLLKSSDPPTAITSNIFLAAFGLMKAAETTDCEILAPKSKLFAQLYPNQVCIDVPTFELGKTMTEILIKILNHQPFPKTQLLETNISYNHNN